MIYGQPVTLTATGTISPRQGKISGFYVNSTTVGTIALADSNGAIGGTITPAVGWHFYPIGFQGALSAVIGGTLNVTFIVQPT
jgi:hypothetical protein